jgi:PTH1 family peptidyl-tRNA hydrolase
MKIVVGLGNPGIKYAGTRHNMGFSAITEIADRYNVRIDRAECKSLTGRALINGEKVLLAMPQTFMNLSGEAVSQLLHYYKCTPEDLIIIYDDIDLDVGGVRIREKGSAGGHNGMKNIIQLIGTNEFDRVRLGVGRKPEGWDLADHVLSRFPEEQLPDVRAAVKCAADAVEEIIENGIASAMNKYSH